MMKTFFLILVLMIVSFAPVKSWAAEKLNQAEQEIPEYFLAPDGPFKDKEAYEKALAAQKSEVLSFADMYIYRSDSNYEICKEDLKKKGNNHQEFLFTRCGMLMQGFADGSQWMLGTIMWGIGEAVKDKKHFCISGKIDSLDMARIVVTHFERNMEEMRNEGFNAVILSALREKYPCPWLVEFKWKMRNATAPSDNYKNK